MKKSTQIRTLGAMVVAAAASLVASCGGDSNDDTPATTGIATTIDVPSVTKGINAVSALIPVCSSPAASQKAAIQGVQGEAAPVKILWLAKKLAQSQRSQARILALTSIPPADTLGDCGGRMLFPASSYSHASGVTTATLAFENYCTVNTSTGNRALVNGTINFVDTGTPSPTGPIRSKIEAHSPASLTIITQDATGKQIDSDVITFNTLLYTVGVPGGTPTASNPDQFQLDELKVTNKATGKVYRETDYTMAMFQTASGGLQFTGGGRSYRTGGEYFDVSTNSPIIVDSASRPVSGAVTFTGANGSAAVATLLPGDLFQATMTVNGTPLAGMPACR